MDNMEVSCKTVKQMHEKIQISKAVRLLHVSDC